MKNISLAIMMVIGVCFVFSAGAQKFIQPASGFSIKKTAYLTLADGTKIEGQFKSGKNSLNGGYKSITFKTADGEKLKLDAEEVSSILIPQSKLGKIGSDMEKIGDVTQWGEDAKINEEAVKEGYYYYETVVIAKKKKDVPAIRQILNPGYSDQIKVMSNEMAMKGASASIGGFKVAEGNASSYFIKVGDGKAIKVKSGDYKDMFPELYGSCPSFMEKYKDDIKWNSLEEHVFEYSQMCGE